MTKKLTSMGIAILAVLAFGALFLADQIVTPVSADPAVVVSALRGTVGNIGFLLAVVFIFNARTLYKAFRRVVTR